MNDRSPEFKFEFDVTREDLRQLVAARYVLAFRSVAKPLFPAMASVAMLFVCLMAFAASMNEWWAVAMCGYVAAMTAWIGLRSRFIVGPAARHARAFTRLPGQTLDCGHWSIVVSNACIHQTGPFAAVQFAWGGISDLKNTTDGVWLLRANGDIIGIPHRAFETADQQRAFIAFVERQIALQGYQSPTKA